MNRRYFSSIIVGSILLGSNADVARSSVDVDFKLSVDSNDATNIESIKLDFDKFYVTPYYLNENEVLQITAKLNDQYVDSDGGGTTFSENSSTKFAVAATRGGGSDGEWWYGDVKYRQV